MTTTKLKSTMHLKFVLLILLSSELVNYVQLETEVPLLSDDQGWSSAPDEKATKFRLTIKDIQQQESGTYTCTSPRRLTHSIVIIVAMSTCHEQPNPSPPLTLRLEGLKLGQRAIYSCPVGYSIEGISNSTCLASGNWSSPPPTCNPIQCPSLYLEDPHLSLTELNTSAWGKAVFKCSWGYRLSGPPSLECEASGSWSGPVPRCRAIQSAQPLVPINGRIDGTSVSANHRKYAVGALVTFSCNEGHLLVGEASIVCTGTGFWSHPPPFYVYWQCTGVYWPLLNKGEAHAIRYLQQIDGILSIPNDNGDLLWYVRGKTLPEHHGKIYRSNNQPKPDSDLSTNSHGNASDTCAKTNNNAHMMKRPAVGSRSKVDCSHNGYNHINGNYNSHPRKKQKHQQFSNRAHVNGYNGAGSTSGFSSGSSTATFETKTTATLYNFELVGDDFFLELAKIDLGCNFINQKPNHGRSIQRSGLCISGQSISDATRRLERFVDAENMSVLINLGTVDILHGRFLSDMCQDYINLIKTCERRGIRVIITTLAPVANHLHSSPMSHLFDDFNEFLKSQFSNKHLVIDIAPCMMCPKTKKILFGCYQREPKYVSGSHKPHLLWNRIGRQRILQQLKLKLKNSFLR